MKSNVRYTSQIKFTQQYCAGTQYLYVYTGRKGKVDRTRKISKVKDNYTVMVDVDKEGKLLGVEIIFSDKK